MRSASRGCGPRAGMRPHVAISAAFAGDTYRWNGDTYVYLTPSERPGVVAEVLFRKPDEIFTSVQRAVRRALMAYSPVPQLTPTPWRSEFWEATPAAVAAWDSTVPVPEQHTGNFGKTDEVYPVTGQGSSPFLAGIPLLRLIGQIGATYLVAEGPDGLYLIDQHAAHERVLFEKMQHQKGNIPSQALLEPMVIQLPPQSAGMLQENLSILQGLGFDLQEFGQNSFRLTAIPALFAQKDPQAAIRSVVEDFEEDETPLQGLIEDRLIARICKRMAIKGGSVLTTEEQKGLLRDLEACTSPRTCPHGRPTMIHLSVDLLERQFGRRGARSV